MFFALFCSNCVFILKAYSNSISVTLLLLFSNPRVLFVLFNSFRYVINFWGQELFTIVFFFQFWWIFLCTWSSLRLWFFYLTVYLLACIIYPRNIYHLAIKILCYTNKIVYVIILGHKYFELYDFSSCFRKDLGTFIFFSQGKTDINVWCMYLLLQMLDNLLNMTLFMNLNHIL